MSNKGCRSQNLDVMYFRFRHSWLDILLFLNHVSRWLAGYCRQFCNADSLQSRATFSIDNNGDGPEPDGRIFASACGCSEISPRFTTVVVLTLALGIGTTTTIFSVFKAAGLQSLPFHELFQLVILWEHGRQHDSERDAVNRAVYVYWKEQNNVCSDMTYVWNCSYMTRKFRLVENGTKETIQGRYVPSDCFLAFGVEPTPRTDIRAGRRRA